MRFAIITIGFVLSSVGCATQTDISRTVTTPDGKVEVYMNKSKGFNYNPNFTGTNEQSVHVRDYGYVAPSVIYSPFTQSSVGLYAGQYSIR